MRKSRVFCLVAPLVLVRQMLPEGQGGYPELVIPCVCVCMCVCV